MEYDKEEFLKEYIAGHITIENVEISDQPDEEGMFQLTFDIGRKDK